MLRHRAVTLLFLGLGLLCNSSHARTLSLGELAQSLVRKNPDLVSKRIELERAQIESKGIGRLDTPNLTAQTIYTGIHNKDTSLPVETDQQQVQAELGLSGRLYRVGLGYSLDYAYTDQKQKPFEGFPSAKKDGETITLGVEYDFYRDAGFRVGHLPNVLATQKVRYATLDQRLALQNMTRGLFLLYLEASITQRKIESVKTTLQDAEGLKKHYQALLDEGRLSRVEYLNSEVQVATLRSSVLSLKTSYKEQIRSLLAFSGASEDTREEDLQLEPLSPDYIAVEKIEALKSGGDRRANGEAQVLEAEKRVLESEAEDLANKLLPSIKLVGGKSWQKNQPGETVLTEADVRSDRWFVGIKLQMPLDGIGPRTDLAAKRVQVTGLGVKQKLLTDNVETRLRGIFSELDSLDEQLKVTLELERLNSDRYKATIPLLERTSTARLDIFDFQNQLREQRARVIEIQSEILRRRAEILYLNGTFQLR